MSAIIEWDDRQDELDAATTNEKLSDAARAELRQVLAEGESFNHNAYPSHGHGFSCEGEMNAVLGPAEEGETNVVLALRAVLEGRAPEARLHDAIARCRVLYAERLAQRRSVPS